MTTLLVDWLGRGGIAQTSEAWVSELTSSGHEVLVVTRPGRELAASPATAVSARQGRIRAHAAVANAAARTILDHRPATVVVQNYVIPALEWRVYEAARRVGARLILVVHDHRLHSRWAGSHAGLRRCIRAADVVVAHTEFVAKSLGETSGRTDIVRLPLPVQLGMLSRQQPDRPPIEKDGGLLALHFGTLQRGYKGTAAVLDPAQSGVDGWRFGFIGAGAPTGVDGIQVVAGFIDGGALVSAVSHADATVLPYSYATQSGAIVLAQALGSVVVASAVGGIPEQVEHRVTGMLVDPKGPMTAWRQALDELRDPALRRSITEAARRRVWDEHAEFTQTIDTLVR